MEHASIMDMNGLKGRKTNLCEEIVEDELVDGFDWLKL
jgi:hypothetical protein